VNSSENGYLWR